MKHLFFVQSAHLEFLSASIINELGLNPFDCQFFCLRGYRSISKINTIDLPKNFRGNFFRSARIDTFKDRYAELLAIINFATSGQKFLAYLPQFFEAFVPFVVTHPDCVGFYHIEEGLHSSIYPIDASVRNSWGSRLELEANHLLTRLLLKTVNVSSNQLPKPCFSSSSAKAYFCISDFAYPGADQRKKIKLPLNGGHKYLQTDETIDKGKKCVAIPIDSLNFRNVDELEAYTALLVKSLHQIPDLDERVLLLKMHPKTKNHSVLEGISKIIDVHFCDENLIIKCTSTPLEYLYEDSIDVIFIGGVSSVLAYASISGKEVLSCARDIHNNDLFARLHHSKSQMIEAILENSGVKLISSVQ